MRFLLVASITTENRTVADPNRSVSGGGRRPTSGSDPSTARMSRPTPVSVTIAPSSGRVADASNSRSDHRESHRYGAREVVGAVSRVALRRESSDERWNDWGNCKPFANGSDITGPHGTGLDERTVGGFVDKRPLDLTESVQMDGSRVSSSPPSDTEQVFDSFGHLPDHARGAQSPPILQTRSLAGVWSMRCCSPSVWSVAAERVGVGAVGVTCDGDE